MTDRSLDGRSPSAVIRRSLLTGTALVLPLLLTFVAIAFLWSFVSGFLAPFRGIVEFLPVTVSSELAAEIVTGVVLLGVVFVVGFVAEERDDEGQIADTFEHFVSSVPGIGTIYTTASQLSEVVFESDTESFQEVKLVEFPTDDVYMIAFLTAQPHEAIQEEAGADLTLFLPLAPNPFMGGFLINVPEERVRDVDMTVEEGVQSIVTSGVATTSTDDEPPVENVRDLVNEEIYGDIFDKDITNFGEDGEDGEGGRDRPDEPI